MIQLQNSIRLGSIAKSIRALPRRAAHYSPARMQRNAPGAEQMRSMLLIVPLRLVAVPGKMASIFSDGTVTRSPRREVKLSSAAR
jgi:hypothetical protein